MPLIIHTGVKNPKPAIIGLMKGDHMDLNEKWLDEALEAYLNDPGSFRDGLAAAIKRYKELEDAAD